MAEDTVANQDPNTGDDFDLDAFFLSDIPIFDIDLDHLPETWDPEHNHSSIAFQSSDESPSPIPCTAFNPPPPMSGSPDSISSFVNYIELFLMEDVDWGGASDEPGKDSVDNIFSGIGLAASDSLNSDMNNPEPCDSLAMESQSKEEKRISVLIGVEEEGDDFISKKRARQMRNPESAMMSRERKKMYINDLEEKNKHQDSECRRLDYALRCSMVETLDLRQKLQFQTIRPSSASMARQESAVLFMESLLLRSLFWFVSLAGFFLFPYLQNLSLNLKKVNRSGRNLATEAAFIVRIASAYLFGDLKLKFLRLRRRCRGMRGRIKFFYALLD